MRKLLVLLGLVLGIGWGGTALAQSGSDSSGTHSYSLECVGEDLVGTNTGQGTIWIYFPLAMGSGGATLGAGESENFGTPGVDTAPAGAYFEVWFEDPEGSGNMNGLDSGNFPDCAEGPEDPEPEYSYTVECDSGTPVFHNTSPVVAGNLQSGLLFVTREGGAVAAVIAGATLFMEDGAGYTVGFQDPSMPAGDYTFLDEGTAPSCEGEDMEPPALISECDGTDWYIVHPGGNHGNWQYRLSDGVDSVTLYDADYNTSNPPAENAFFGEVLVPEEINEVNYIDDFNGTGTLTRPNCTTGGGGGATTVPPTTQPTEPTTPGETPETPTAFAPITGEGFVAPGAEIGPGMASFGVTGFGAGEVVDVTLFSTPRSLGTVTATDDGTVSITFEVLASDGAGEHRVQFSGPSGTFSVPFTLVLPAQSLPVTR